MQHMYICSNCRAPVAYGGRFCGYCGTTLNWILQQIPPQSSFLSYNYPYADQQQIWDSQFVPYNQQSMWQQQTGPDQTFYCNEEPATAPEQRQQKYQVGRDDDLVPNNKASIPNNNVAPISTEISRLLSKVFDKHAKYTRA